MKMFIPEIGTKIILTKDFNFNLFTEERNLTLWNHLGLEEKLKSLKENYMRIYNLIRREEFNIAKLLNLDRPIYKIIQKFRDENPDNEHVIKIKELYNELFDSEFTNVTLEKGTVLIVDRIYIRKGASGWSSISFFVNEVVHNNKKGKLRFWAKLDDVNNINFNLL